MNDEITEIPTLKEAELNEVPGFYKSLANNPVADMVKNHIPGTNFFNLIQRKEITTTIPAGSVVGPFVLAGQKEEVVTHRFKNSIFPFVYTPVLDTLVFVRGARAEENKVYVDILNGSLVDKTVTFTLYLYKFIQKR